MHNVATIHNDSMDDVHKYNWDEMIKMAFHADDHRINNTG
jgi:hypothetical protein